MWKPMTGDHPPALPPFRLSAFPSLPYVAPFATFMLLLELGRWLPAETPTFEVVRVTVLILVLWLCSRSVITLEAPHWFTSIALGIGVFAIWIAPDVLIPNWRIPRCPGRCW